jgi:hypothetical protein
MPPPIVKVNGLHLVLNGITGDAADRNGVATINVPVHVPDIVTALMLDAQAVAAALGIGGLTCTGRPLQQLEFGEFQVNFQFEGLNSEVAFDQAENLASYSFTGEMGEAPIQTHPEFAALAAKYGWLKDEEKFAAELGGNAGNSGSTPYSQSRTGKKKANPMAGVESYFKAGATYSRTYAVTSVPASVYLNQGTLIEYPPGAEKLGIPKFKGRVWLKMAPTIDTSAGSAIRVTENYKLTGQDPTAAKDIYGRGQLEE